MISLSPLSSTFASDAIDTLQYHSPNALFAAGTSRLKIETVGPICEAFPNAKDHVVNSFEGQLDKLPPKLALVSWTRSIATEERQAELANVMTKLHPALFAQATSGKLRCAVGEHVWLRSANLTVTYAPAT